MPLISQMLSHNARLRQCLVSDSAHVTQGSRGAHVTLIHKCLVILDNARIAPGDLDGAFYGPSTVAAVLAYKRKRGIINRSYQDAADPIVGKMTIARFDKEIALIEMTAVHGVGCTEAEGAPHVFALAGGATGNRLAVGGPKRPSGPVPPPPVKHNKRFDVMLQATESAGDVSSFVAELLKQATKLGADNGFTFSPGLAITGPAIKYPDNPFKAHIPVERLALRNRALATTAGADTVLRVIFAPFDPIAKKHGWTDGGLTPLDDPTIVPKYCIINTASRNPDRGTLLHEMIHAAYPAASPGHDGNPRSVYSIEEARVELPTNHAAQLAIAYFAR